MKDFIKRFKITDTKGFKLSKHDTAENAGYKKDEAEEILTGLIEDTAKLQTELYAANSHSLLIIFQAMDAAGKDSSIRRVFKGVNPSRFRMAAFKKPETTDLKHDFLWRFWQEMPERGNIGVFNRSYYEEVLALRVHPDRLEKQSIPENLMPKDIKTLWKQRFGDIAHFEDYLFRNGFPIVKLYLHVDRQEQGNRLLARLDDVEKQWKLSPSDLKEREFWDEYMKAYEDTINATATKENPWYVIPSDDRKNQQLIIASILTELLEGLPTSFPETDEKTVKEQRKLIKKQDE